MTSSRFNLLNEAAQNLNKTDDIMTIKLSKNYSFDPNQGSDEEVQQNTNYPNEILAIRIPAKVKNRDKAVDCLGGLQSIKEKSVKGENINYSEYGCEVDQGGTFKANFQLVCN